MQINEIYRNEVHGDKELADINQWVSQLISEGYDLDDYSDEELYAAYLIALDEGFKPTNYTRDPNIFHGRGKKAQQIDRQIEKFKKTGDVRAQQIDFVNRMMDDPEGRKYSIKKSRINRMSSTHKAREDAERDIKKYGMKEELDLYDVVSEYLVSEGFCDSYEDADVIMVNMSEQWRDEILDEVTGGGQVRFRKGLPGKSPKKAGMKKTPQRKAAEKLGGLDVDPTTDPQRRERLAKVALR